MTGTNATKIETASHSGAEAPAPDGTGPSFAAATAPSYARTLFFARDDGGDTLRAGWGFVFYAVGFFMLQRVADSLVGSLNLGALRTAMASEFASLVAAVIPALVLARIQRWPWSAFGMPLRQAFGKLFWIGAVWGFAGITLLLAALHGLHVFDFGHIVLHGARIAKFGAFWAGMFLLVGLFEEFLLRGYTQFTLARGIGFWWSAAVLSCVFGAVHLGNGGEDWRGVLAAGAIGLFFCLTLRRTGTLWFAVGFHAAWDWGESFFYSVPDSGTVSPGHLLGSSFHGSAWLTGGSVGPEGSVMCFVVMVAVWVTFSWMYPGKAPGQAAMLLHTTTDSSSLRSSE
ncbi:MAG TPA: type II CAAX endopeptidase family protein [Candidatus Sulfotelmatobacter sp.]|nr:type II CAAX endopeptidase family protein [Candidatus Sulfotelmatobacter sp.]